MHPHRARVPPFGHANRFPCHGHTQRCISVVILCPWIDVVQRGPVTAHVVLHTRLPPSWRHSVALAQQALERGRGQAWAKLQKLCKGVWGCQLFSAWMSTFWSMWKCTGPLQVPCMASSLSSSPPPSQLPPRPGRTTGGRPRAAVVQRVGREYLGNHPYYKS